MINNALQYVGNKLGMEDIGKLLKQMPYSNLGESFNDMTLNYDTAINDILALDRGEQPPINQYDDHPYMVKKLVNRMRMSDFRYLDPKIQQTYGNKVRMHEQFEASKQMAIQRAQAGLIPTGGYMTKCDLYVPGATPDSAPKRMTIPSESLQWLLKQIEVQQSSLAPLAGLPTGAQAEIADQFTQGGRNASEGNPQAAINQSNMTPALQMGS